MPGLWTAVNVDRLYLLGVLDLQRPRQLRCARAQEEQTADQLIIVLRLDTDGKASLELDDAGQLPVIKDPASEATVLAGGNVPNLVDYETLRGIEHGQRAASLVVEWIDRFFEAGRPVE